MPILLTPSPPRSSFVDSRLPHPATPFLRGLTRACQVVECHIELCALVRVISHRLSLFVLGIA